MNIEKNPYIEKAIEWERQRAEARKNACTDYWKKMYYDRYPNDPLEAEREMNRAMGGW